MARRHENILLSGIHIEDGRMAVDAAHVERLMKSIGEIGLLEPIIVCRRARKSPAVVLVAGRNRLEACKRLKHKTISAIVETDESDETDRWRELAEIDENLIRRELTAAQRAALIGRRKKIYEKANPETKHGGDRKSAKAKSSSQNENLKAFVEDTVTKTGKARSTVARDATRANSIEVLPDIINTSLDKGSELDALAKLPANGQRALAERAKAGEQVSARKLQREVRAERKLELEFEQRVRDECRRRIEETILPAYNKSKDEYDSLVKSRRGVMTKAEYNLIRACLHPDNSMTGEKRQKAWDLFSALEIAFLDERERPTSDFKMPRTYEEMMELKRKVSEARRAKRNTNNSVSLR